jgi:hypothetical protein
VRCFYTRYLLTRYLHGVIFSSVYCTCKSTFGQWILITLRFPSIPTFLFQDVTCLCCTCMCGLPRVISNPPSPIHTDFLLTQCALLWLICKLHSQLARSNPHLLSCKAHQSASGSLHLDPAPARNRFRVKTQAFRNGRCKGVTGKSACR